MAKAKVNSGAESDMPVRFSLEVEFLRISICLRVQVCGRQHGHDLLTPLQPDTAKLDILPYDAVPPTLADEVIE
jgi:hypothetical protein